MHGFLCIKSDNSDSGILSEHSTCNIKDVGLRTNKCKVELTETKSNRGQITKILHMLKNGNDGSILLLFYLTPTAVQKEW